jgi:hypothetical protein
MRAEINFPNDSNVICPVQTRTKKYSACPVGANQWRISARLTQTRGGSRSSRTRVEMRWTRQRRARNGIAGQVSPVSDQPARGRTALQRLRQNFGRRHVAGRGMWWRCCVRRRRVVLASVADVKSAEVLQNPTGMRRIVNPQATVTTRIRRRGERAISRKAIAQGRPDALR